MVKSPKLEYMVVSGDSNPDKFGFLAQVAAAIADGWMPLGGVQITRQTKNMGGTLDWYHQAMIRRRPWWRFWK